jgi:hypothetical protein
LSRRRAAIVVVVVGVSVAAGVPVAWQVTRPAASAGTPPTAARPAPAPAVGPVPPVATRPAVPATGRADPPVRIRIPALGVDAAVEPVGVTSRGLMVIPERVERVGWYRFGPAPGARSGSVVLAGHVDSARQGRGALFGLRSLGVGERIDLVTAGGRTASYRVTGRETIVKRRLPAERLFDRSGAPRLVLVTCGGPFDEATSSYRDNLVVAADPVTS